MLHRLDRLNKTFRENIAALKSISNGTADVPTPPWFMAQLIKRLVRSYHTRTTDALSVSEIEKLCYHISEIEHDVATFFIEEYVSPDWNFSYQKPLERYLLNNWGTNHCHTVQKALSENEALNTYFNAKGPENLANYIRQHDLPLKTSALELLNTDIFTLNYFGIVIREHYRTTQKIDGDEIYDALSSHNNIDIARRVIANLVSRYKNTDNYDAKDNLVRAALRLLGNTEDDRWNAPPTFSNEDAELLCNAKETIKTWIAQGEYRRIWAQVSQVDQTDGERIAFWKRKARHLRSLNGNDCLFKLICPSGLFINVPDTLNGIKIRVDATIPGASQNNAAIIMRFGKYTVVEFLNVRGGPAYFLNTATSHNLNAVWGRGGDIRNWLGNLKAPIINYGDPIPNNDAICVWHRGPYIDTFNRIFNVWGLTS